MSAQPSSPRLTGRGDGADLVDAFCRLRSSGSCIGDGGSQIEFDVTT